MDGLSGCHYSSRIEDERARKLGLPTICRRQRRSPKARRGFSDFLRYAAPLPFPDSMVYPVFREECLKGVQRSPTILPGFDIPAGSLTKRWVLRRSVADYALFPALVPPPRLAIIALFETTMIIIAHTLREY